MAVLLFLYACAQGRWNGQGSTELRNPTQAMCEKKRSSQTADLLDLPSSVSQPAARLSYMVYLQSAFSHHTVCLCVCVSVSMSVPLYAFMRLCAGLCGVSSSMIGAYFPQPANVRPLPAVRGATLFRFPPRNAQINLSVTVTVTVTVTVPTTQVM